MSLNVIEKTQLPNAGSRLGRSLAVSPSRPKIKESPPQNPAHVADGTADSTPPFRTTRKIVVPHADSSAFPATTAHPATPPILRGRNPGTCGTGSAQNP